MSRKFITCLKYWTLDNTHEQKIEEFHPVSENDIESFVGYANIKDLKVKAAVKTWNVEKYSNPRATQH